MTLRMGDGPPGNLPADLDARAGYVNVSGIGQTWEQILAQPARWHLSISTNGSPAHCADVETGAMADWLGYTVGYCPISWAGRLIASFGRPRKLWTAHRNSGPNGEDVAHICDASCWPGLPADFKADGTQWTNHGGAWDESLLADDFFDFLQLPIKEQTMIRYRGADGLDYFVGEAKDNGNTLIVKVIGWGTYDVMDVTDSLKAARPNDPRAQNPGYQLA